MVFAGAEGCGVTDGVVDDDPDDGSGGDSDSLVSIPSVDCSF